MKIALIDSGIYLKDRERVFAILEALTIPNNEIIILDKEVFKNYELISGTEKKEDYNITELKYNIKKSPSILENSEFINQVHTNTVDLIIVNLIHLDMDDCRTKMKELHLDLMKIDYDNANKIFAFTYDRNFLNDYLQIVTETFWSQLHKYTKRDIEIYYKNIRRNAFYLKYFRYSRFYNLLKRGYHVVKRS